MPYRTTLSHIGARSLVLIVSLTFYVSIFVIGESLCEWEFLNEACVGATILFGTYCIEPAKYYCRAIPVAIDASNNEGTFVDVYHTIKTRLTVLRAELEMLGVVDPDVDSAISHISELLHQLVQIERLSMLHMEHVCLSEIVVEQVARIEYLAEEFGVQIFSDISPEVYIQGNAAALGDMCMHILHNACKYRSPHTEGMVRIELARRFGRVRLVVKDNGIGIDEEDIPHVFERLYRASGVADTHPGTGLGLSFVEKVVRTHGGSIDLASKKGVGTTITISLPIKGSV